MYLHIDASISLVCCTLWILVLICLCLDSSIGFTTRLQSQSYSTSDIIKGSPILYNQGNAYNGTVFTCPSPGLYLFQVSVISTSDSNGVWIYKNLIKLTLAYFGNVSPFSGASVSAAVWLNINDQVYLRLSSGSMNIDPNSVFIGVKIR